MDMIASILKLIVPRVASLNYQTVRYYFPDYKWNATNLHSDRSLLSNSHYPTPHTTYTTSITVKLC